MIKYLNTLSRFGTPDLEKTGKVTKSLKMRHKWPISFKTGKGIQICFQIVHKIYSDIYEYDHLFGKVIFRHLRSKKNN